MEIFMLLTHSLDNDDNADEDDNDDTDKKNLKKNSSTQWWKHYSTEETNMEGYTSIFFNILLYDWFH